jgi:hypothetical protein
MLRCLEASRVDTLDDEFWHAVCKRAMAVIANRNSDFLGWTMTVAFYDSRVERAELERRVSTDGFVGAASGYFDRSRNQIVVILDAQRFSDERSVRELLEAHGGICEDDPEVSAARWVVESIAPERD